jgi:hypothetical protein
MKYLFFVLGYLLSVGGVVWILLLVFVDRLSSSKTSGMVAGTLVGIALIASGIGLLLWSDML